jgi:hypothetical protein
MTRALKLATTVAAICATLVAYGSTTAGAAPTQGKLSATEYKQLSSQLTALEKALAGKSPSWSEAAVACRRVGVGTPLLKTQRNNCIASVATIHKLLEFSVAEEKCAAGSPASVNKLEVTATTATTPNTFKAPAPTGGVDGVSAARLKLLKCLGPDYRSVSVLANQMYVSDLAARKEAVQRGFKGLCLRTLADTPADLKLEQSFAADSKALASDVTLLIKVSKGTAPASSVKGATVTKDGTAFAEQLSKLLEENGPDKLSVCSHA